MPVNDVTEPAVREVIPAERSVLIVEDDRSFLQRLAKALEQRGFIVSTAESVADGLLQVEQAAPAFAVVDMRLGDGNGLDVICALKRRRPGCARHHPDRLRQYRNRGECGEARRRRLSRQAGQMPMTWWLPCSRTTTARSSRRKIRCRPTACAGNTFNVSTNCVGATFRKPRAGSTCIGARYSGSWPNARHGDLFGVVPSKAGPSTNGQIFTRYKGYWIARFRGR